jgi:Tol biopolymer transport system component
VAGRLDGLWVLPLDGTPPSKVLAVDERSYVTGVSWAPGGTQIAYTLLTFDASAGQAGSDLHVADLAGQDRVLVQRGQPGTLLGTPVWASDGVSLLYDLSHWDSTTGFMQRIERVAADGSWRVVEVENAFAPSVSADGRLLAYLRVESAGTSLWLRDLATGTDAVVIAAGAIHGTVVPALAPDGGSIVFAANGSISAQPVVPACAPPLVPPVVGPQGWLLEPRVALAHGVPKEIWQIGADGTNLRKLTSLCLDDPVVTWSPDGAWLAAYGGTGLLLVRSDGTSPIPVWTDGSYGGVDWTN